MTATEKAREHHLAVERTARYWTLGDESADDVWIVLHGYNQLARRFIRRFTGIAGPDRFVVAPGALSRFYVVAEPGRHTGSSLVGASWMTREDLLDRVAVIDLETLSAGDFKPARIETELLHHGRVDVGHVVAVLDGVESEFIGGTDDGAFAHAATGEQHGHGIDVMAAA